MNRKILWSALSLAAAVACARGERDVFDDEDDDAERTNKPTDPSDAGSPLKTPSWGSKDAGGGKGASSKDTDSGSPPSAVKRVFITAEQYKGDLGGVIGADNKCSTAAQAAALGGTWKAWIADSTQNAVDRINDVGPWYAVDGKTKMFDSKANLTTASLPSTWKDELGKVITPKSTGWLLQIWTGAELGVKTRYNCSDWTNQSSNGTRLDIKASTVSNYVCFYSFQLLCIEQ